MALRLSLEDSIWNGRSLGAIDICSMGTTGAPGFRLSPGTLSREC